MGGTTHVYHKVQEGPIAEAEADKINAESERIREETRGIRLATDDKDRERDDEYAKSRSKEQNSDNS